MKRRASKQSPAASKRTSRWLTHATSATRFDAELALEATHATMVAFGAVMLRHERGTPERCPNCSSYRVSSQFVGELKPPRFADVCKACGWVMPNGDVSKTSAPAIAPSLGAVADVFSRYANTTFGGGSATIAVLHRQLERRGWIDSDQFAIGYALSRATPGTNLLAFCAAMGWMLRGAAGAIVALLASSIPCATIVVAATALFDAWQHIGWANAAVHGAVAAAVAITVSTGWTIARPYMSRGNRATSIAIAATALLLYVVAGLSPASVLVLAAIAGALLPMKPR